MRIIESRELNEALCCPCRPLLGGLVGHTKSVSKALRLPHFCPAFAGTAGKRVSHGGCSPALRLTRRVKRCVSREGRTHARDSRFRARVAACFRLCPVGAKWHTTEQWFAGDNDAGAVCRSPCVGNCLTGSRTFCPRGCLDAAAFTLCLPTAATRSPVKEQRKTTRACFSPSLTKQRVSLAATAESRANLPRSACLWADLRAHTSAQTGTDGRMDRQIDGRRRRDD